MKEVKGSLLGKRTLSLLSITVVSLIIGGALMIIYQDSSLMVFPESIPLFIIVSTVFTFGFLFFGYLTPLPMFFVGAHLGKLLMKDGNMISNFGAIPVEAFLLPFSSMLVAYSSIILGDALLKDMAGTGNFLKVLEISISLLVIGIGTAVSGTFLL